MNLPRIQVNWNKVLNHRRTLFITCGRFPRKTSQSLSGIVGLSQLESAQGGYRQLPRYTVCTTHSTPRPPVRSGTCEYHRIPTKQRIFSQVWASCYNIQNRNGSDVSNTCLFEQLAACCPLPGLQHASPLTQIVKFWLTCEISHRGSE